MRELLSTLFSSIAGIRTPLTLWAFVVAALLTAFYSFLRSVAVHKTWSPVLSEKLAGSHFYRLLRLSIIVVLVVVIAIIVAAFVSPLVLEHLRIKADLARDSIHISEKERADLKDEFRVAWRIFREDHDYTEARKRFALIRQRVTESESREVLSGLVTATYYGAGQHRQGLEYLCELYSSLPKTDVRYRFAAHAHLRRIALKEGYATAERVASEFRTRCGRADFSQVWQAISLSAMEGLARGFPPDRQSDEDQARLRYVIERYPKDEFLDHAHLALGDYDLVRTRYHPSIIEDVATLGLALSLDNEEQYHRAIPLYEEYLTRWPHANLHDAAIDWLVQTHEAANDTVGVLQVQERFGGARSGAVVEALQSLFRNVTTVDELSSFVWEVTSHKQIQAFAESVESSDYLAYPDLGAAAGEKGDFVAAAKTYTEEVRILNAAHIAVPTPLKNTVALTTKATKLFANGTSKQLFDEGLALRDYEGELMDGISRRRLGEAMWVKAADRDHTGQVGGQALYLAGRQLLRNSQFDKAYGLFERLVRESPKHPLADDALAEMGYIQYVGRDDRSRAKELWQRVVSQYPKGNAADDALSWLGYVSLVSGDYKDALSRYVQIIDQYGSGDIAKARKERPEQIRNALSRGQLVPVIDGVELGDVEEWKNEHGLRVVRVVPGSAGSRAGLLLDDIVTSLGGHRIDSDDEFREAAAPHVRQKQANAELLRGDKKIALSVPLALKMWYPELER
jgi:tetratricopeptide (TPR) repeat protein